MLAAALRSCTRQKDAKLRFGIRCLSKSHNEAILEMLKKERECYSQEHENPDGYKIRAFSNAIKVIERLDKPLMSGKDAMKLKGVGVGISDRISAFLDNHQDMTIRKELLQIPGIGVKKTQELLDAGCKNIRDLRSRKFFAMLSHKQNVYLKYMDHLKQPITREEAETVARFIRDNLRSQYEVIVAGDFRRGLRYFPQLEIILLHPNHVQVPIPSPPTNVNKLPRTPRHLGRSLAIRQKYLPVARKISNPLHGDVVPNLSHRGLICETTMNGDRRWEGIVRIPELVEGTGEETAVWRDKYERIKAITAFEGTFRQMSIVLTPQKARAATLLALTGDSDFVKCVRYKALSLGLYLDEFGLWRWHSCSNGAEATTTPRTIENGEAGNGDQGAVMDGYWELVQVSTEEDIFSALHMEYVQPERRNLGYLKVKTSRI